VTLKATPVGESPRTARRRPGSAVFALTLLGVTLAALGHVAVQAKQVEIGIEIGKEESLRRELRDRQRHLTLEIQRLRDPGRIMSYARDKLKMQEVDTQHGLRVLTAPRPGGAGGAR
jgi:cell division protein FtsL